MAKGAAKGSTKGLSKVSKWYKSDDERVPFNRRQVTKQSVAKLRGDITPGTVLILLAGKYRGKRVVFLNQLKSGLLLVTGPHKVNGVPLKRVNQVYTISTSTKVDVSGVKTEKFTDAYFTDKQTANKTAKNLFKAELTEEQKKKVEAKRAAKKADQQAVDTSLVAAVKKVKFLKEYLASRFSLSSNDRPHELKF